VDDKTRPAWRRIIVLLALCWALGLVALAALIALG
jgi:hypothetical protein